MAIVRQAVYFPSGNAQLFGWFHSSDTHPKRDSVAIVCPPLGYEYTHSHRSMRHLADQLAMAGIDTLRFDYHGTGDSTGTDIEPDRLSQWQQDVASAVNYAKQWRGCSTCCVIGVRLGGMLAALSSCQIDMDWLVLWNPITRGRTYIRELKATAVTTEDNAAADTSEFLESGGFLISAETEAGIRGFNLLETPIRVQQRALVVQRDDLSVSTDLQEGLIARGVATDQLVLPGYADMMARLEVNVVPMQAIGEIVNWFCSQVPMAVEASADTSATPIFTTEIRFEEQGKNLREIACRFGADKHLFGILTTLDTEISDRPTLVFLNSGSVHHVGPGRLYVGLARELARCGFNCFRMDIEGLGDSVLRKPGRENHPYPDYAVDDTAAALQFLRDQWQLSTFVLTGVCSGAYTAFLSGVQRTEDKSIRHLMSINPLTFKWIEGETLLVTQQFKQERWEVNHYKSSARDWKRWIKLLSGKADYAFIVKMVTQQVTRKIVSSFKLLLEKLSNRPSTELGAQLETIVNADRTISFFIASGDPGYDLILRDGGYYARKLIQDGKIAVHHIANADHTFSRLAPRTVLVEKMRADLRKVFGDLI